MTISARAAGYERSPQRMSCSPSIEQFAIHQNATPFATLGTFCGFQFEGSISF